MHNLARSTPPALYRTLGYAWEPKPKAELEKLMAQDVIELVTHATAWCHGIVCVEKSSGDLRLCVDFRLLNKYNVREPFHQLSVIELVQSINADDAQFFFKADASGSYNQCALAEESRDFTTFITPFGR